MKTIMFSIITVAAASTFTAANAATKQPPMNNFNSAFYACDDQARFAISYDGPKPGGAKLTTSNNSKNYDLKRSRVQDGVEFKGEGVTFWTDGDTVRVAGTQISLANCKLQQSS